MSRFTAPIAEQIWDMKYRFKEADGSPIDQSVEDTWRRIARSLASVEADPQVWEDKFYGALEDFKYLPAGRITAGAGTERRAAASAMISARSVPRAQASKAWRRMRRGRCRSWMSGIRCAAQSCPQARAAGR